MKYYLAPLQGVTGYIFRNAYARHFGQIDKYFTPFISPTGHSSLNSKELRDVLPANNPGITVVPQVLTNNAQYFIELAKFLKEELGYEEINLNLGCPSGTVVAKQKGSGLLAQRERLNVLLEDIFKEPSMKISIKTRIGLDSPEEFGALMKIYNQYPLEELIIHPRIQKDFYKNMPNMVVFGEAMKASTNTICYNGDIFNLPDYQRLVESYPTLEAVMLGRGLLINPGLIEEIHGGPVVNKKRLIALHEDVYQGYLANTSGEKNFLFKMKEFWFYMIHLFAESEKYEKKIKKVQKRRDYDDIVGMLFQELELADTHKVRIL